MNRLLIFHPIIAPYRIDFFNDLSKAFEIRICLRVENTQGQKFDYDKISSQFRFTPYYLKILGTIKRRIINSGYWKHLDEFSPDIVMVEEYGLNCLLVLLHRFVKRKKYKVVSICDDNYNMVVGDNDFSRTHHFLRKWVVPLLDDLILVEPKVTSWFQNNYGKGIFFPIIKKEEKARAEYERVLPLSRVTIQEYELQGKRVFLFVGRLVAIKNVEAVIKAFATLPKEDNVLVIVGDGPEKVNLYACANETNSNIIFTGRLEGDELNQWYNIADCFVLASYQETFGAVTNEALLAGCYALVSEKAGSSCLVKDGLNGWTFNPMDVDELAEKMKMAPKRNAECSTVALGENRMIYKYDELLEFLVESLKKNSLHYE